MILAIVNQKGGVGKTTTAVSLAHGLAIRGQRVLIVDLDTQGQVATSLGLNQESGLLRLLVEDAGARAITDTGRPNLWAVLSDKKTVTVQRHVSSQPFQEYALDRALADIKLDYDVIILDTAPTADLLQINALLTCSHLLIPTKIDHLSCQGASATLATVASLKKLASLKGVFLGILPTMWSRTPKHTKEMLEELALHFGNLLWSPIPQDAKVPEATLEGRTLWEYAPLCRALSGASTSTGLVGGYARAVERLIEELG